MSQDDNNGDKPDKDKGNKPPAKQTPNNLTIGMDWNEEQLKALRDIGLEDAVNQKIASYEERLNELEQKQQNQEVEAQRKELLLELSNVARNPKLVEQLKEATPETIKGAIITAKASRGPARFGEQSQETQQEQVVPSMIDPKTGKMVDHNGRVYQEG